MRLGIIGTGHMASQMAQAASTVPDMEIAAVLSRDVARAGAFCASLATDAQPFDDLGALLGTVDAIYVATPPGQHAEVIRAAIAAQTPVLCEKPLTPSAAETAALLGEARNAGVLVMEALWTLALPAYRALKAQVDTALSAGDTAQLRFDFSYPLHAPETSHYFDPETGGVLLDRGVYGYGAAIHLLGPVARQQVRCERNAAGLDMGATLHLTHEAGHSALITLSLTHMGPNSLDVALRGGMAALGPGVLAAERMLWQPAPAAHTATLGATPGKPGLKAKLKAMPALRKLKSSRAPTGAYHSYGASCYAPILQAFQETATSGATESPLVPHAMSCQIADLVAAARASHPDA